MEVRNGVFSSDKVDEQQHGKVVTQRKASHASQNIYDSPRKSPRTARSMTDLTGISTPPSATGTGYPPVGLVAGIAAQLESRGTPSWGSDGGKDEGELGAAAATALPDNVPHMPNVEDVSSQAVTRDGGALVAAGSTAAQDEHDI